MFFIIGSTVKGTDTIWSRPRQNYFGSKLAVPIRWQLLVWLPLGRSDVSSSKDSESSKRFWLSKRRWFHLCLFFRLPLPSRKLPRHLRCLYLWGNQMCLLPKIYGVYTSGAIRCVFFQRFGVICKVLIEYAPIISFMPFLPTSSALAKIATPSTVSISDKLEVYIDASVFIFHHVVF